MNQQKSKTAIIYTFILYVSGFFLFLEWLYPLEAITDTTNSMIFFIYTLFCFFISIFQWKWWIGFLLKGFALLFILNGLYIEPTILSALWLEQVSIEFTYNIQALFSQQWYYLTPLFRSFLFLLLIWLMSYLLHYWFVQMKRIFLFVLLTMMYITILDTFTPYDGQVSIIRTFIISFVALGIANLLREMDRESIHFALVKHKPIWLASLIVIVFLSSMIGFAAPKAEPKWPDPVPFIQSTAGNVGSGGATIQKVGYGEDDTRLGGSFIQDDNPVFTAHASENHYWRIETKDLYTGKGWVSSTEPNYESQPGGSIALQTFADNVETEEHEAFIEFYENETINKLVYPYGIKKAEGIDNAAFFLDTNSDAIEARINGSATNLSGYQLTYDHPSFEMNALRNNTDEYTNEIIEQYTQVPDTLPERVGDLAEEITAGQETTYDQAKAIERYFASNDFVYQTKGVPVPSGDEDYVDQFLFESQVGYCDNFSTSMVVMLRTLDIPARWAKGFTSGEAVDVEGNRTTYEVTNANAHSWVEVYFPESGWVSFEPTQGFSNLSDFHVELDENGEETEEAMIEPPEVEIPEQPEPEFPEEAEVNPDESMADASTVSIKWWHVVILLAIIATICVGIYKTRYRWKTKALAVKLHHNQDAKTFQDAYHYLMNLLNKRGYTKDPDQTLGEFAKKVDTHYSTDEMGKLTNSYERMLYKNETKPLNIPELIQLWKNLIKRIMG
ncbi:DUF4129 domain-containing transglutaminase family protein [Oceanobacillus rekensis]|uniref:DUF4129 domain-containing transglutaminase family protein n=1 Tax=Oceanobacillus rekensis TaxID=937927 RepID=UPI000B430B39|nr:transglutaminase domain-containing protein [Oceanobacillus rekensis]